MQLSYSYCSIQLTPNSGVTKIDIIIDPMSRLILNIIFLLALGGTTFAQNWMLAHQPSTSAGGGSLNTIRPLDGGGYIAGGYINIAGPINWKKPYMVRIDDYGNIQWERTYDFMGEGVFAPSNPYNTLFTDVLPSSDGGFFGYYPTATFGYPSFVMKTDAFGDTLWVRTFTKRLGSLDVSMVPQPDGGLIMQTEVTNPPNGSGHLLNMIRLDSSGNTVFDTVYTNWDTILNGTAMILRPAPDGNLFLCGTKYPWSTPFLSKWDTNGNLLWEKELPNLQNNTQQISPYSISVTPDSGVVMGLFQIFTLPNVDYYFSLYKFDQNGDSVWYTLHDTIYPAYQSFKDIHVADNGDILSLVVKDYTIGGEKSRVVRYDPSGNFIYEKSVAGLPGSEWWFENIREAHDGGMVLCGSLNNHETLFAVHLDSLAENNFNLILGKAYMDSIPDCQQQGSERDLSNWMVRMDPGPVYTLTDSNGNYSLLADSGDHWVSIIPPSNTWADLWHNNCPANPDSHFVSFLNVTNPDTANNIDFAVEPDVYCPLLQVDIVAPFLRRCSTSVYYVNYCNYGTLAADSAYIEVTFDTSLTFSSATIPFIPLTGNSYRFDIGNIPVGDCGDFQITVNVPCDTTNPGRTHCAVAHIYPDSFCIPFDTSWSGASLTVEGECTSSDTMEFTIRNNGTSAMTTFSGVWVVEDDILRLSDSIQLGQGLDTLLRFAGNGSTWACLVNQVPHHPGQSIPRAIFEGCGTNGQGLISTGFATQFAEDDLNPWISIHCIEDGGSYDPNDKRGFPSGRGQTHEVLASDEMEYMIRFQNTGTDTAFRVVIRDRIPATLDISTFVPGPASHPYTVEIVDGNMLEWTFHPIFLPDSTTNEAESQGFVSFSMRQTTGNTIGTRLENAAGIYFDFNPAVITDTAWHTIGEELQAIVALDEQNGELDAIPVLAYPNPFQHHVTFDLGDYQPRALRFEMFDLQGKMIKQMDLRSRNKFTVQREGLIHGVYPFRLTDGETLITTGKLVIIAP